MRVPLRIPVQPMNKTLMLCLGVLLLIGLVALYSASYPLGMDRAGGFVYLQRQLFYLGVGLAALMVTANLPYRWWDRLCYPLMGLALFFLVLVFVPGLGVTAGGAKRWIGVGALRFQPSEFAKLALVIFLARSVYRKGEAMQRFSVGVLPHLLIPSVFLLLVILQPDFGSFMTMALLIAIMLYVGGARVRHLAGLALAAAPAIVLLVAGSEYRRKRFLAFLDPWANARDSGFQIIQSHLAFHMGGLTGAGLGEGKQKLFYLPDIHTDFILSVVGEEMGFAGVALVVFLFLVFTIKGLSIAMKASRAGAMFSAYLATGITLLIAVPAFTNMAVVLGLLPTKGLVLPFLSYGGSALVVALAAAGILLNLSRCDFTGEFS